MADSIRVLVTAASKHGATDEIADAIASELTISGTTVTRLDPEDIDTLEPYDAIVVGSAIYAGRWQKDARRLIERFTEDLRTRDVWLFSSGPIGNPPMPAADPVDVAELMEISAAIQHRTFSGSMQQSKLSIGERAIVAALRAEYGDFRDWEAIRRWAQAIADRCRAVDA